MGGSGCWGVGGQLASSGVVPADKVIDQELGGATIVGGKELSVGRGV